MQNWKNYVNRYEASPLYKDDVASARACQLAAEAAELGTYAVGAVLLDEHGGVLTEGFNEVFVGDFRSDQHAEMVVLTKFETEHQGPIIPGSLTLVSSLEPCPMCMSRLIYAGIGTIRYVCEDPQGGMVSRKSSLPPTLQKISEELSQDWGLAECSEELRDAAFHLFEQVRDVIDRRIVERGQGGV